MKELDFWTSYTVREKASTTYMDPGITHLFGVLGGNWYQGDIMRQL